LCAFLFETKKEGQNKLRNKGRWEEVKDGRKEERKKNKKASVTFLTCSSVMIHRFL
jgi:hypothetical protein